ncbi:hypothetical protein RFI_25818, partial [Reticulomyxa filosa]
SKKKKKKWIKKNVKKKKTITAIMTLPLGVIKPQNSVITNITYQHIIQLHILPFHQKKLLGKKDYEFYYNRFSTMQKYFNEISKEPDVTFDEGQLTFFKLQCSVLLYKKKKKS